MFCFLSYSLHCFKFNLRYFIQEKWLRGHNSCLHAKLICFRMWWQNFYPNVWVMGRGVFRFVTKRIHEPLQFFLINKAQLKSKNHLFSRLVKHWNKFLLCNYAACQFKLCLKNRVKRIKTTQWKLLQWCIFYFTGKEPGHGVKIRENFVFVLAAICHIPECILFF